MGHVEEQGHRARGLLAGLHEYTGGTVCPGHRLHVGAGPLAWGIVVALAVGSGVLFWSKTRH
ncbi:hypothetical protein [Sinomonas notoginsengisoli]|uniref:hypothetical protein n=1 Tax=Sinomonas notoginsengisoli TaxID=1457311 RepID=UPI001F3449DA|nr:hypothetical protein [Sinomonas notoginsengisoli]